MKNAISELKHTVKGIKSRLDEAGDRSSELKDEIETPRKSKKRKRGSERMKRGLRECSTNCPHLHNRIQEVGERLTLR